MLKHINAVCSVPGIPDDRKAFTRKYEGVMCEEWNLTAIERGWQTALS